jgi:uncharacterized membrane protein YbhN (UPF0104 family)
VLGDVWSWLGGVVGHIGDVSIYWLVLALVLKTAESGFIAIVWRNILDVAYPRAGLSFKTAWGVSQGGTAINAVAPAQAGTAAMIAAFRASIPGSSVAGVTTAAVVQSLFFTGVSVLMVVGSAILRPRTVSKGSPSNETGGFVASHLILVPIFFVVLIVVLYFLWPGLKPRLLSIWNGAKKGAAIFGDWRRYAREVALPSAASYTCRIGVNVVFMAAFSITITAFTILLVASSHMLSQLFAITPGGVGQTQALDVITLRGYGSADKIAAFSITQYALITIWNVVLGVVVVLWAFGFAQVKDAVSKRRSGEPRPVSRSS